MAVKIIDLFMIYPHIMNNKMVVGYWMAMYTFLAMTIIYAGILIYFCFKAYNKHYKQQKTLTFIMRNLSTWIFWVF